MSAVRNAGLALAMLAALSPVCAQQYPNRPVRLIVPYEPGGTTDVLARFIAQEMGKILGQQMVVDNRPGASGTIGTHLATKSTPDGHTLLLTSLSPLVINIHVSGKLPYDPVKDLAPVSLITDVPSVIGVLASSPLQNVNALVAQAKANPGKITYGSSGSGGINHLSMELFRQAAGITLQHIPYKGAGPAVIAVLGKQVDLVSAAPPALMTHIRGNRIRPLVVTGLTRSPALPDVPTVAETISPNFKATAWYCFMAPPGTPRAIVNRVREAWVQASQTPVLVEKLIAEGAAPESSSPEDLGKLIRADLVKWGEAVKAAGAKLD